MSCPSIFELSRFIEGDSESPQFELHVSSCDLCAQRLSGLAKRSMEAHGLTRQLEAPRASTAWCAVLAVAASVAMITSAPAWAAEPSAPVWSPEDVHGVVEPLNDPPRDEVVMADAGRPN